MYKLNIKNPDVIKNILLVSMVSGDGKSRAVLMIKATPIENRILKIGPA